MHVLLPAGAHELQVFEIALVGGFGSVGELGEGFEESAVVVALLLHSEMVVRVLFIQVGEHTI
jgi:hypothetical protein